MDFSIIIPTYNRPAELEACLAAFERLDYPRDKFEIIVVDDGSEQPLVDIIDRHRPPLSVSLLRPPHGGPARARNIGAKAARGAYLVFMDDDCSPGQDLLKAFGKHVSSGAPRAMGGNTINALRGNIYAEASQELISYLYRFYDVNPSRTRFFTTSNIALPREVFHSIGGFDETFPLAAGEDRDLCERWLEGGFALKYVPGAIVYHNHHLSLKRFARQHFTYGRGARHLHRARERRGKKGFSMERKGFYPGLFRYPFTRGYGLRAPFVAALFILSQVAYAAGYARELRFPLR